MWNPPPGRIDIYAGYDVLYFNPSTGEEVMFHKHDDEFFQIISKEVQDLGPPEDIFVKVLF